MPRFVILHHEMPPDGKRSSHWDFMLQWEDVLKTWALDERPETGKTTAATALDDHRTAYLDYEGPISDDRGSVTRWDAGTYRLVRQSEEEWVIDLAGNRLTGRVTLVRASDGERRWLFTLAAD
ncbi:MAG: hypothetical protein IID44_01195 [Planctomycetes bacterium]|nr:hypothetical protein [Planctomycetota bacterium]